MFKMKLFQHNQARTSFVLIMVWVLSGCATMPDWLPASGASREQVQEKHNSGRIGNIQLVDVNDKLARKLAASKQTRRFSELFPDDIARNYRVGAGDTIEITVWETPPAMLFGVVSLDALSASGTARAITLPAQMVDADGTIGIPFGGRIPVQGHTVQTIEKAIAKRLQGKANQPQVMVRVVKNNTSNVTIVGDINNSTLMPLTPKGERLLDAVAVGGGVKQAINRMSIQLSRNGQTASMPLDLIIRDPKQNILLKPGDVITALYQPQSFSVLGATGKNEEIPFEAQGISLAQALARSGGLTDNRADARGVFVFRFEDANLVTDQNNTSQEPIPVVYQIDLRDPAIFFVMQHFPIQNHDVLYVANSPSAEFEKFLRLVVSVAVPTININRALTN